MWGPRQDPGTCSWHSCPNPQVSGCPSSVPVSTQGLDISWWSGRLGIQQVWARHGKCWNMYRDPDGSPHNLSEDDMMLLCTARLLLMHPPSLHIPLCGENIWQTLSTRRCSAMPLNTARCCYLSVRILFGTWYVMRYGLAYCHPHSSATWPTVMHGYIVPCTVWYQRS